MLSSINVRAKIYIHTKKDSSSFPFEIVSFLSQGFHESFSSSHPRFHLSDFPGRQFFLSQCFLFSVSCIFFLHSRFSAALSIDSVLKAARSENSSCCRHFGHSCRSSYD